MASFQLGIATDWGITLPWLLTLVVCITVDVVLGVGLAWNRLNIDSTISRKGMFRKSAVLMLVVTAAVMDGLVPSMDFVVPFLGPMKTTLGGFLAFVFLIQEVISILEKAAHLGVKLPKRVMKALLKVQDALDSDGEDPKQA
jgi:toxin secretion/phage lysis holin